ncbi:hypothetical protein K458DRAFT_476021 [Lentithecium fluviatile CBS 122367]|uniref:MYND-type domain-containing protein n=1 Tax=Lentithecium fluviatile CBS 122367 TaxID=1168545 RepID=A0A6G1J9Z9_9PLEO|nr:hypothetical protein K458DRAFT_476021 [Lentithecium fluviatile CBS 122367]
MPEKCKNRERIANAGTPDIPFIPVGAIRGYLCFRCFTPSSNILKCSACKRAGYCSKACQKLDWSIAHKNHCKIFKTINEVEEQQYQRTRSWDEYRTYLLTTPYCASCRRTAVQLANRQLTLKRCEKCRLVFSCGDCPSPPAHSDAVCEGYRIHANVEEFRISFFEDTGKASPVTCTQFPRKTRKLLMEAAGWYDYFVNISDKPQITDIIKPDFSGLADVVMKVGTAKEMEDQERMRMFLLCATDNLTMPLTIVSALEDGSWDQPALHLHIVGATTRELVALGNFEEILHLVPGLRSLHITAAGPGLAGGDLGQGGSPFLPKTSLDCCPACKADGRTRSISIYQGLYHDFEKTSNYDKPDLTVLFNSGWIDGEDAESDWAPTIQLLVNSDVPALFTTYNEGEVQNETRRLREMGAKFLVEPGVNKWRGLVPAPEFIDEEYGMWYQNAYRYVIQGKE